MKAFLFNAQNIYSLPDFKIFFNEGVFQQPWKLGQCLYVKPQSGILNHAKRTFY